MLEDIAKIGGIVVLSVAVVILTFARNRSSAYQTAKRFQELFARLLATLAMSSFAFATTASSKRVSRV